MVAYGAQNQRVGGVWCSQSESECTESWRMVLTIRERVCCELLSTLKWCIIVQQMV